MGRVAPRRIVRANRGEFDRFCASARKGDRDATLNRQRHFTPAAWRVGAAPYVDIAVLTALATLLMTRQYRIWNAIVGRTKRSIAAMPST
jgi:hypothetical protein